MFHRQHSDPLWHHHLVGSGIGREQYDSLLEPIAAMTWQQSKPPSRRLGAVEPENRAYRHEANGRPGFERYCYSRLYGHWPEVALGSSRSRSAASKFLTATRSRRRGAHRRVAAAVVPAPLLAETGVEARRAATKCGAREPTGMASAAATIGGHIREHYCAEWMVGARVPGRGIGLVSLRGPGKVHVLVARVIADVAVHLQIG